MLMRRRRGAYTLTNVGALVVRLHGLLLRGAVGHEAVDVAVRSESPAFDRLFPAGSELYVELARRLAAETRTAFVRVVREQPE
jgi:hypothetical protein